MGVTCLLLSVMGHTLMLRFSQKTRGTLEPLRRAREFLTNTYRENDRTEHSDEGVRRSFHYNSVQSSFTEHNKCNTKLYYTNFNIIQD